MLEILIQVEKLIDEAINILGEIKRFQGGTTK